MLSLMVGRTLMLFVLEIGNVNHTNLLCTPCFCIDLGSYVPWSQSLMGVAYQSMFMLALRGALVGLMLFLNGMMLTFFLRALERNSSISVTVLSTVSNIITSVSAFIAGIST